MAIETFLMRTMSDTVETDIQRVLTIANEILSRYELPGLSLQRLRKIADGPFDLFLIPLIFANEYQQDRSLSFNETKLRRNTATTSSRRILFPALRNRCKRPRKPGSEIFC